VDVATAYNGQLYDMAIVDICHQRLNPGVDILPVTERGGSQRCVRSLPSFNVSPSGDRRRYGKLLEELENSFTKGNDDYPEISSMPIVSYSTSTGSRSIHLPTLPQSLSYRRLVESETNARRLVGAESHAPYVGKSVISV
jgi:hypothetical protein